MRNALLCLCLLAVAVIAGCTIMKVESRQGDTYYSMVYRDFRPSTGLMDKLGDALKAAVAAMSAQKLPTVNPPVTPPVVPPVVGDPDPITDPVPPVNPPYKVGKIEDLHGGFVWKPVSENTQKLAVLTPYSWGVGACVVYAADGVTEIETATYSGLTNPDAASPQGRPTYRFTRPGSAFPANCVLSVGAGRNYVVADPSKRYD